MIIRELLTKFGFAVDDASTAKAVAAGNLVARGMEKVAEWLHEGFRAFEENVKGAIEYGNVIAKTSQKIGIATDALQELEYAAKLSDVGREQLTQGLGHLARTMQEAKDGSAEAGKALKGIAFKDSSGKIKDMDVVLAEVADKFKSMPNGAEKTARSMQIFGRAGKDLIPFLNEGSEGIAELRQEARDLGLVLDNEAVEAGERLNDNLERLHMISKGLWRQVVGGLLPGINRLVARFLAWRKENAELLRQKLKGFLEGLIKGVNFAIVAFQSFVRILAVAKDILGTAAKNVIALARDYPTLTAVILGLAAAFLLLEAPLIAVVGFFTLLYAALDDVIVYLKGGDSLIGRWQSRLEDWLKPREGDTWFVTAIKNFIALLNEALKGLKELEEADNRLNPKSIDKKAGLSGKGLQSQTDRMTIRDARKTANANRPFSDAQISAMRREGLDPDSFRRNAVANAPELTGLAPPEAPARSAAGMGTVFAPVVHITTQPGQSNEAIGEMVGQKFDTMWDARMEEAGSGVLR